MAYEYQSKLYANSVVHSIAENTFIETGETKEIKEVYRKAKAFERIKDIHSDYSIGDAKCIEMIGDELERADDER